MDNIRYNLASLFKELNKLDCDDETKKKYFSTLNEAIKCVEKCRKIVRLNQKYIINLELLEVMKVEAPLYEQHIKEELSKKLAKSMLECGIITVERDVTTMQNIYTLYVEVVNNNE